MTHEVIMGVTGQLGPCYYDEDNQRVIRQIMATARELGMGETPCDARLLGAWQQSHMRYVTLQRHLRLADRAAGMVTTVFGHGSARGHHESATTSRGSTDDIGRPMHMSSGDPTEASSALVITSVCLPSGIGGWAVHISEGDQRRYPIESRIMTKTTANRLALRALIGGLEQLADNQRLALRPVEIVTDSEFLVDGVARLLPASDVRCWYRTDGLPIANGDLWRQVACRLGGLRFRIQLVQATTGKEG